MRVRTTCLALLLAAWFAPALPSQQPRIDSSRATGRELLKLPKEEDAFGFLVFGDRTGGPVEGIEVLKQAVADANLLDPDLVFTVGDLINGYNQQDAWMAQAKEFRDAMAKLRMPWFPVAGNHDIYWRGDNKPDEEHEGNYETTFGPLWYSVRHKQCLFVALYSDEANPATGERNFNKPECQKMSEAQFAWLDRTLADNKAARHVFVFLHHPRWLAQYGTDWDRVHARLSQAGNVTAVFAGHIHRMRFDGVRDGIQYFTVASVGAHLEFQAPQAGYLHQYHVVTVRKEGITVAALPVGTVIDVKQITGELSEDVDRVHANLRPVVADLVAAGSDPMITAAGAVDAVVTLRCTNPGRRPVEFELIPVPGEGFTFSPDHQHVVVPPGKDGTTTFALRRVVDPTLPFGMPNIEVRADYLAADRRVGLPVRRFELPMPAPADLGHTKAPNPGVLVLDGKNDHLALPSDQIALAQGPFTVELWARGEDLRGRRGLVCKSQQSEFGVLANDGAVSFSVFLGDAYVTARSEAPNLTAGRWHHVAGVFDGKEVRVYVDGKLAARTEGQGTRKTNAMPLMVGADPKAANAATAFFAGCIDDVRISKLARYSAEFAPETNHSADADTVWLLPCDHDFGPWTPDRSGHARHARRHGAAHCTVESRPGVR